MFLLLLFLVSTNSKLEFSCFSMIQWMLAIWSLVPLTFLHPACTSRSSQFMYCWSLTWRILSITSLVCEVSAIARYFEHSILVLIPKISVFTLAIFCLITYNLPWFMNLTFQVPMQYCSLQHRTLLSSPVTSTIGQHFCFGSACSFFLDLFLHSSSVGYRTPANLGSSSFNVMSFCLFILFMGTELYKWKIAQCWARKWHPTPVLLLGKSHGRRSLVGCSSWGREESDTTERLHFHFSL